MLTKLRLAAMTKLNNFLKSHNEIESN